MGKVLTTTSKRKVPKNISIELDLIAAIDEQMKKEGETNFSAFVVKALRAYLGRVTRGKKEAA